MISLTKSRRQRRLASLVALIGLFAVAMLAVLALRTRPPQYVPGEGIEGIANSLGRTIPKDYPGIAYSNVAEAAGIRFRHFHGVRSSQLPEDMGSGAAWGDYDSDGFPDLFLANEAGPLTMSQEQMESSPARCALYRNNGDGSFTDVTDRTGLGSLRGWFMAAAWGDYDNDGDPDLVVTAYGENRLFQNDGKGRFADVSRQSGVGGRRGFWAGASWGDYDRDGFLDLYICGYVRYREPRPDEKGLVSRQFDTDVPFTLNPSSYPPVPNLLYRNQGDGTFEEVARKAGVDNPSGRSLAAAWCDFDDDGYLDLYVNNDLSMHAFYRNLGNGRFEDISASSWACDYRGGMGIAVGDWDNDADMDFFLTHWLAQENGLYLNLLSENRSSGKKPRGPLRFVDISDRVGLGQSSLDFVGWGTSFLDVDNDGRLDLAIANGSTMEEPADRSRLVPMRNQLYWNGGSGEGSIGSVAPNRGYFEVEDVAGDALCQPNVGRGLAVADFDRDGATDIAISRNGSGPLLLKNRGGSRNNWLAVKLQGTRSNRDAIGAKVTIWVGKERQLRHVGAGCSYLSQDELVQQFGLGQHAEVDRLEVWWPSGLRQRFSKIAARQTIRILEGGQPRTVTPRSQRS